MKYIYGLCVAIGILVVLGAAGASDCGTIEFGQAALRGIVGLLVAFIGVAGFKHLEEASR
jgi:hypothetical protein